MEFYQSAPVLTNTYLADPYLQKYLKQVLPAALFTEVDDHLKRVGALAAKDWLCWSEEAEKFQPEHISFDAWGRRVDQIHQSSGWRNLEAAAAREGIVAKGYDKKYGEFARVYQAALLYLFHPSSAFVSCPLAMTDGAAKALQLYGDEATKEEILPHLLSTQPETFWTSGQWMTERTGGSDVSGTSTTAKKDRAGHKDGFEWSLSGVKWFTSATTSQIAMLLAKPEGATGLSLFMVKLRDEKGNLQNIEILRLKEKLGTKALATAELRLAGTPAKLIGGEGNGVKKIASLFNLTRIYNSVCSVAHWRRGLQLAHDYSSKRMAFGAKIEELPFHQSAMVEFERKFSLSFHFTMHLALLLGREEAGKASEDEKLLLRAFTPLAKLSTAKKCLHGVSECLEVFGGAGYVENTGIPRLLRDAQVFSLWEGTTHVLCLDFLRALGKEGAKAPLLQWLRKHSDPIHKEKLAKFERVLESDPSQLMNYKFREDLFELADWVGELAAAKPLG